MSQPRNVPLGEKAVVRECNPRERLFPALTYVVGLARPKAISAWLSSLSVFHCACSGHQRLPQTLSVEDQQLCRSLLDEGIDRYLSISNWPLQAQNRLLEAARSLMHRLPEENREFLKKSSRAICRQPVLELFWNTFAQADDFAALTASLFPTPSRLQQKRAVDFSLFFLTLTFLYGCGTEFQEHLTSMSRKLDAKFAHRFPLQRVGLSLWPLELTFAQPDGEPETQSEHLALLRAVRAINPNVQLRTCSQSLLWSRDLVAWLDDDCTLCLQTATSGENRFGNGFLAEGGNIITGTAHDQFILVAESAISEVPFREFTHAMNARGIKVYHIPDGFLWARDPETSQDMILDSIHVDTVCNVVPAQCTLDNRPKLIIDPHYYSMAGNHRNFQQFIVEQGFTATDIVLVDERELYLNLPNFSILLDPQGKKRLLANKDLGYTLPRLMVRPGQLVQPAIEITRMAASFGSIRCAVNMLPGSLARPCNTVNIQTPEEATSALPPELLHRLQNDRKLQKSLSRLHISHLCLHIHEQETSCEYDEFTQTVHLFLTPKQVSDLHSGWNHVLQCWQEFSRILSRQLGIPLKPSREDHGKN